MGLFSFALVAVSSGAWSLPAVLERAREAAPQVRLAGRTVDEVRALGVGAGVPFPSNPRLFVDYRPLVVEQPGVSNDPRHGYTLGVDGTFEVSGASSTRLAEVARKVAVAEAELSAEQTNAAVRAALLYFEVLLADERVGRLAASLTVYERLFAAAKERVAAGSAGEPEVTTVAVELAMVRVQLEEARRRAVAARFDLAQLLDWPVPTDETFAPVASEPPPPKDGAALVAQATERRAELKTVRARLALLEATQSRLAREAAPKLGYNVGLDVAPASPGFAFMGLSVELPVAQRNQTGRAVAAAQSATEVLRLETDLRRLQREVMAARESYESRRRQVAVLSAEALPNAQHNNALIEEGWRAGRFDVFRLTTATRELLRLERERVETLLAAWSDWVELQRVSGELTP